MAKQRVVDTLQIPASVILSDSRAVFDEATAGQLRKSIGLLNHALQAHGPYRIGRNLEPVADAVLVQVIVRGPPGDTTYAPAAFRDFLCALNERASAPIDSADFASELSNRAVVLAEATGRDAEAIRKALALIAYERCAVSLGGDDDTHVELSPMPRIQQGIKEWTEIKVLSAKRVRQVRTERGTYVTDEEGTLAVKRSDRVTPIEPGLSAKRRCIYADEAIAAEDDDQGLFD